MKRKRGVFLTLRAAIVCSFLLMVVLEASAQTNPSLQDSVKTGKLQLKIPQAVLTKYSYDPILDRYIYTEQIDDFDVSYPISLTPEEYEERVKDEGMKSYFKEKFSAMKGRSQEARDDQRNLLPVVYINNDFIETIFGGNEIELIPQGSAEVGLGVLYNKRDNPSLSPRNRSSLTLDFDEFINLSLQGHVGSRLHINANYDTHATFDFQNQIKLEYAPDEDDIIRKIEVGNVNMPLNSSLIQGSQSLFGAKAELQFGKTSITGIYSEQHSQRNETRIERGGAIESFEKYASEYDENRHFFLAHYFRNHYDEALKNYPYINSNIEITRVQIWVTNRSITPEHKTHARNIVGIQDLGESNPASIGVLRDSEGNPINPPEYSGFLKTRPDAYPDNANNDFNPMGISGNQSSALTAAIRDMSTIRQGFGALSSTVNEGVDYAKLESARMLEPNEYTLHPKLGYISLRTRIRNDEMLAVAFEYTANGKVYQVGEFGFDGIDATQPVTNPQNPDGAPIAENKSLVVKLLKSPITNVKEPVWDLMMKNIYDLDVYQVNQEDFEFNILYSDPQPLNYLVAAGESTLPESVDDVPLLSVFDLDRLNRNGDPVVGGDGFFDFVPGITIDPENGRLIFTSVEPFGKFLFNKLQNGEEGLYDDPETYNENQRKYVFRSLYRNTKTQADQEDSDKNKFQLVGSYISSGDEGIPIGSYNVPPGSVRVTAGGRELQEGVDYTVDYELGRVKIINESLKASDQHISVSTEDNTLFRQSTKRYAGLHIQHRFNDKFEIGGTYINMHEKPQTYKARYNYEPINNSMYGFNFNYSTEVPFFTRLVNKLPNIDTDIASYFSLRGEFAYLKPGSPKADNFDGESTSYIDDFEASQTGISVLSPQSWFLSSAPIGFGGERANGDLASGYKRAKLNWYTIDPIFYGGQRPSGISDAELSHYATRRIYMDEIFPETDILQGESSTIFSLDLSYYPDERGMYNYNPSALGSNTLPDPENNFGGIMRGVENSDFEQTNVQYIEFWLMDPYIYEENAGLKRGTITFNLGSISEDVLKDGRKQYENGLPKDGSTDGTIETSFGRVPSTQSLVYAFDTKGQERENQDLGLDGMNNADEAIKFPDFANLEDPSNDDYEYFLNREGGIVERYRRYNGLEGNSPSEVGQTNRGSTSNPSTEDVNNDNTMNTVDSYFEYKVPIYSGMSVDNNTSSISGIDQDYITDVREINVNLKNGKQLPTRWVQFRIPIDTDSKYSVGGISDLRSMRFMRMFLTDFNQHVILRFGTLDLVRGDYRKYAQALEPGGSNPNTTPGTSFSSQSVSKENTSDYVSPPGVRREEYINKNQRIRQDEQSLALSVKRLAPNDMRAVYKNFHVDMRQYENLRMFLHAQSLPSPNPKLNDGDLSAFIRIGSDFKNNYYQIEVPLKVSEDKHSRDERLVWPEENDLNLPLSLLEKIKSIVMGNNGYDLNELNFFDSEGNPIKSSSRVDGMRIAIKGNPSFGDIRMLMLGLKNTGNTDVSGEVWFNEFRMSNMKNKGGWAAILNMDTNFADLWSISANGRKSTIGFGALENGPNGRSRENVEGYDLITNINAGHLLPKKWGIHMPVSYSREEELVTPQYDPEFKDIELKTMLRNTSDPDVRRELRQRAEEYFKRQSISIIGLHKQRTGDRTPLPVDIENFTFSGTYNQINHRDFKIEEGLGQNVNVGATYNYNFSPLKIEPFKRAELFKESPYLKPIRDLNFDPLPNQISATSNILRQYNEQKFRQINLPPGSLGLPKMYQHDYRFNWGFTIQDRLTESLDLVFSVSNNRLIRNYIDQDNLQRDDVDLWDNFFDIGESNQHNQTLQANYQLPFDKFPFLNFINAQYSYTGNFQWQRGSEVLRTLPGIPDLGNTIQNSSSHQLNGMLIMDKFYDYLGLKKKKTRRRNVDPGRHNILGFNRPGENRDESGGNDQLSTGEKLLNAGINLITALDRVTINYDETRGTFMPGYLGSIGFIGTLKPAGGFTFGSQSDIRERAASKGWLTLYQNFNEQYMTNQTKNLAIRANLRLLDNLTVELNADRVLAENYAENFKVNPDNLQYSSLTPRKFGNFSISTLMIGTAFQSSTENGSQAFENFRNNRLVIANRLAEQAGIDLSNPDNINPETGYPLGFGRTSQQVILPAFLSAYTGKSASSIGLGAFRETPLPNWHLKYTGLMQFQFFRERFKRFSIQHGYDAGYTINQFQTNLNYDFENPFGLNNRDQNGNYRSEQQIGNINLVEQFSPLVRLDMELANSISILAQVDKDRALSLSFNNNLLTEIQGHEYRFGLGYRIKDLRVTTHIEGQRRTLTSDLNLKADVSFRRNKTLVRYLDLNESQITTGQDRWEFHFLADYALTRQLTAMVYYDHNFSKYFVSTAFPQTTIRTGIRLRYSFGG